MNNHQEVAYTIDFGGQQQRKGERLPRPSKLLGAPIPRIARLLALAIRLEGLIREGRIQDYADAARRGKVTRARMTQIMKLVNLAPDIQETILFLPAASAINERNLRPIAARADWKEQRRLFHGVTSPSPEHL